MKHISKKLIISAIIATLGAVGLISTALATADFTLSLPEGTSYEVGDTFEADIVISPTESIYTAGIYLEYPANLLKVESFSFASTWMPLSQSEYDSIDNTNGLLVKTAGYPGGVDSPLTLGTATFRVLDSGQATVEFSSDTFALNANNTNVADSLGSSRLTLTTVPSEIVPEEEIVVPEEEITPEEEIVPEEEITPEEEVVPEEEIVSEEEKLVEEKKTFGEIFAAKGLLAAMGALPFIQRLALIIVGIIIIGWILFWLIRRRKKITG